MGKKPDLPKEFLERLQAITAKRARAVIDHIIGHGHVTTEELATQHGYGHPPRGARDVRELGIPLDTFFLKDSKGRRMAAYRFADPNKVRRGMLAGYRPRRAGETSHPWRHEWDQRQRRDSRSRPAVFRGRLKSRMASYEIGTGWFGKPWKSKCTLSLWDRAG